MTDMSQTGSLRANASSAAHGTQASFLELGQYNEALHRIRNGYGNLTDLGNFIKDRAAIEENYARELKKWASKYGATIMKSGEYNTCRQTWMDTLDEARSLADQHSTISQSLIAQAQKKVSSWQKDNYSKPMLARDFKQVASYEKEFSKAQKQWKTLYNKQVKTKKDYDSACIQQRTAEKSLETIHVQLEQANASGAPNVEKIRTNLEKQKTVVGKREDDVVRTRDCYKDAVLQCDDGREKYEDDMLNVYQKTQDDEQKRLEFVREVLFDVHQRINISDNAKLREIYLNNENALLRLDVKSDIEWWHNTRGMGVAMQWPTFDEYDPLSAQNTIAHKQSVRAAKHVAGQSAIATTSYKQNADFHEEFEANDPPQYSSPKVESNPFDKVEINNNKTASIGDIGSVTVEAIYEYSAQEEDEIDLTAGMRLMQIEPEDDQGWCRGRTTDGTEGLYPANYVRVV